MNNKEVVDLYPLMPTKYSPQKRKELRKFEKELLEGKNIMLKKSEVILNAGKHKPQTNEEWFNALSTKEKAKWLDKVAENCCQICDEENRESCRGNIAVGCKFENAKKWESWLKAVHKE